MDGAVFILQIWYWMLDRFLNKASGYYIHVEEQNSSLVQHQSIAAKDVAGGYLDKTLTRTLSDFLRKLCLVEFFQSAYFSWTYIFHSKCSLDFLCTTLPLFSNKIFEFD